MTRQQKVYFDAIRSYIATHGCSPSLEDIAVMVGVKSLASVHRVVRVLVDEGCLVRDPNKQIRNIHVVSGKLDGFNSCDRAHVLIFFQTTVCPLCAEMQKHTPPRSVRLDLYPKNSQSGGA